MISFFSNEIRAFAEFISDPKYEAVDLYVIPGYDTIQTPDGEFAFAAYNPDENRIIAAEGVSEELQGEVFHHIAHEYYHHIQHERGVDFDEDDAEKFAQNILEKWEEYKNENR